MEECRVMGEKTAKVIGINFYDGGFSQCLLYFDETVTTSAGFACPADFLAQLNNSGSGPISETPTNSGSDVCFICEEA